MSLSSALPANLCIYILPGVFYNKQEDILTRIFKAYKDKLKNTERANYHIDYLKNSVQMNMIFTIQ